MKICWDNLEKVRYNKKTGTWIYKTSTYHYIERCIGCSEPFLATANTLKKFCSNKCSTHGNNNPFYNKTHSEITKKLMSKNGKGKNRGKRIKCSEEIKRKISESKKGKPSPRKGAKLSEATKNLLREINLNKILSQETRRKISESNKGKRHNYKGDVYKKNIPLYDTYAPQIGWCEEVRRDPEHYDWLQVRCTYSECRESESEGWFNPTQDSVYARIRVLKGKKDGGNNLYCSEKCKNLCPIYNRTLHRKGEEPNYNRDPVYNEWSVIVKERDNYTCQRCGSTDRPEAHHIEGLNENDMMSLDLEIGITLCHEHHKDVHRELGCRYFDLRKDNICEEK